MTHIWRNVRLSLVWWSKRCELDVYTTSTSHSSVGPDKEVSQVGVHGPRTRRVCGPRCVGWWTPPNELYRYQKQQIQHRGSNQFYRETQSHSKDKFLIFQDTLNARIHGKKVAFLHKWHLSWQTICHQSSGAIRPTNIKQFLICPQPNGPDENKTQCSCKCTRNLWMVQRTPIQLIVNNTNVELK